MDITFSEKVYSALFSVLAVVAELNPPITQSPRPGWSKLLMLLAVAAAAVVVKGVKWLVFLLLIIASVESDDVAREMAIMSWPVLQLIGHL